MAARKSAETEPEVVETETAETEAKPPVKVPSIMGSTFAERAAANKAVAKIRAEAKG